MNGITLNGCRPWPPTVRRILRGFLKYAQNDATGAGLFYAVSMEKLWR